MKLSHLLITAVILSFSASALQAVEEFALVKVADAFIELRSGPGRGYPVFFVAERGELIEVLKSKTSWYKVRLPNKKQGWVHRKQLKTTLTVDDEAIVLDEPNFEQYLNRSWELGVLNGDFEGASLISMYGGYHFTKNLSTELSISQILGDFSEIRMLTLNLVNEPFPEFKPLSWFSDLEETQLSPFFGIGVGLIETRPRATLVQTQDRMDNLLFVTTGAKLYLTRRFLIRLEYRQFVVLTDRNQNEEVEEWKLGFSIFF